MHICLLHICIRAADIVNSTECSFHDVDDQLRYRLAGLECAYCKFTDMF